MPVRSAITLTVVLFGIVAIASPAAADTAFQQTDTTAYTLTSGRLWSLIAAALGLIGLIIGVLARTRILGGTKTQKRNALLALLSGLAGAVIGGVVVAIADGGPGSGSGIVGGYVALLIGLIAMVLGGLALKSRTDPPVRTTSRA